MKRFIVALSLGLMVGFFNINKSEAQVHISINIDIQPAWGPSGYDYAEYYYIPELNIYYDVLNQLFYYLNQGRWIRTMYLPVAYSYYDFYSLYKVVLNNIFDPWRYNRNHIHLYQKYCYNYRQIPIFYMGDSRYYRARDNYRGWVEPRYMPQNEGRPRSRDFAVNTHNGRVSTELRSASANEALRNSGSSGATVSRTSSSRESSSVNSSRTATSRSSNETPNVSRGTSASRASSPATGSSSSRESTSFTGNNDNARSVPMTRSSSDNSTVSRSTGTRSSASGVNNSRTVSGSSSSGVSTRSTGSSVRSSSSVGSNSRTTSTSTTTTRNSNSSRSNTNSSRGR